MEENEVGEQHQNQQEEQHPNQDEQHPNQEEQEPNQEEQHPNLDEQQPQAEAPERADAGRPQESAEPSEPSPPTGPEPAAPRNGRPTSRYSAFFQDLRRRLLYPLSLGSIIFRVIKTPFVRLARSRYNQTRSDGNVGETPPKDRTRRASSRRPLFASSSMPSLSAMHGGSSGSLRYRLPQKRRYGRYRVNFEHQRVQKRSTARGLGKTEEQPKTDENRHGFFGKILSKCRQFFERPEFMISTQPCDHEPNLQPLNRTPSLDTLRPTQSAHTTERPKPSFPEPIIEETVAEVPPPKREPLKPRFKRQKKMENLSEVLPNVLIPPTIVDKPKQSIDGAIPSCSRVKSYETARLFISNLGEHIAIRDIQEIFGSFGDIRHLAVHYNKFSIPLGTATVQYSRRYDARRAMFMYNGRRLAGRRIRIEISVKTIPAWLTENTPLRLYISRVHSELNDLDLTTMFSLSGELQKATVHYNKKRWHLGTADIKFKYSADALEAVRQYSGYILLDKILRIEVLMPMHEEMTEVPRSIGNRECRKRRRSATPSSGSTTTDEDSSTIHVSDDST